MSAQDGSTPYRPATPTPWTTLEDGRGRVKLVHVETTAENEAGAGLPVCSIPTKRIADAEYLVHAANAYRKLVRALREARLHLHQDDGHVAEIDALLRELGEIE